jgi:sugar lactone lactonase YvrE
MAMLCVLLQQAANRELADVLDILTPDNSAMDWHNSGSTALLEVADTEHDGASDDQQSVDDSNSTGAIDSVTVAPNGKVYTAEERAARADRHAADMKVQLVYTCKMHHSAD